MNRLIGLLAVVCSSLAMPAVAQPGNDGGPAAGQVESGAAGWVHEPGSSAALMLGGRALWRFNFDSSQTHTYFHPLALPGIESITMDRPADHVHHHGLWFSWKYIDGVNFWEHAPGSERPAGRTVWTSPHVDLKDDGSALFEFAVVYWPGESPALRELRRIEVSAPASDGAYSIGWTSRFEAIGEEVKLDRTPLPGEPGGQVYGGYAGLSARLVHLDDRLAVSNDGPVEFNDQDRYRERHDAFEYAGTIDGRDVGIAILSHPDNLNSPSPWYAIRSGEMSFFAPAVLCYGPVTLQKGERFELRYRVIVHPGRWGPEELAAAFGEYTGAAEPGPVDESGEREE